MLETRYFVSFIYFSNEVRVTIRSHASELQFTDLDSEVSGTHYVT
jgi:hypothetical protein